MQKKELDKAKARGRIWGMVSFVISGIILTMLVVWCYSLVTQRVIDMSQKSIEELAKHDEQAITSSIRNIFKNLNSLAFQLKALKSGSEEELMENLEADMQFISCVDLMLVAEDGYTVSGSKKAEIKENIRDICDSHEKTFISREIVESTRPGEKLEYLLAGIAIEPMETDGHTYTHLALLLEIDTFQNELKIDSFDGMGYSSVIDREGNYIVNVDRTYNNRKISNFFDSLRQGTLPKEYSIERIHQLIEEQQRFAFQYDREGDETCLVVFDPMPEVDWFFVTAVPRSVFEKQGLDISKIFALIMLLVVLTIFFNVTVTFWRYTQLYRMERKHRKELADALSLAQQANRAKTVFLNNMSHDIRTPMNAIIGFTTLASTHLDNKEKVRDYLKKISQSADHLLSLINDVLDMSRIESGKMEIVESPENLAEMLHGLRNIILADIHSKQLNFYIDTENVTDENIYCDKLRLNQVLLNLLSNAMKFTPPGGEISMRIAEKKSEKEGYAAFEFRIKDTGIGMSPEFVKTIFEPFTRERTSTVSGIQGTGLGMSITKNIVDMMNGTIEVSSEQGKGSEFVVAIEFRIKEDVEPPQKIEQLEGLRGLVVDDDINFCQSAALMLRQMGMRAEWTVHGTEAVIRAEEALKIGDEFHVCLIDWLMPDMNGIEAARRIRKVMGKDVPIIILTAYDWTDIEDEAIEAGVTDFVNKPLFLSDLRRILLKRYGEQEEYGEKEDDTENLFCGSRILLAEDNELNQEIAVALLEQCGFIVEVVSNGEEAVAAVKASKPGWYDIVIMDVQMPVMGGYEATKAIRAFEDKELASIPIVAMTANAFEEDKKLAEAAGMNAHIGKPIDIPLLKKTIREIMQQKEDTAEE